jgi:hypothetical protein
VRADALEACIHFAHLLAHLQQQAEQLRRGLILGRAAVRARALAGRHARPELVFINVRK